MAMAIDYTTEVIESSPWKSVWKPSDEQASRQMLKPLKLQLAVALPAFQKAEQPQPQQPRKASREQPVPSLDLQGI